MFLYHRGTTTLRISPNFARVCTTVVQTRAFSSGIRIAPVPPWYKRESSGDGSAGIRYPAMQKTARIRVESGGFGEARASLGAEVVHAGFEQWLVGVAWHVQVQAVA